MTTIHDRLPELVTRRIKSSERSRAFIAEGRDEFGNAARGLSTDLRHLAIGDYVLKHDVEGYRAKLSESVRLYQDTIERYDQGDTIDWSHVSMIRFHELFDALATGDLALATEFARLLGGREEAERRNDHPFMTAMGYGLKAAVLRDEPGLRRRARDLEDVCGKEESAARDIGYARFLQALADGDVGTMTTVLHSMIKLLPKACYEGDCSVMDEALFIRGIGLVNLARGIWGIDVPAIPLLIPEDLVVPMGARMG